MVNLTAETWSLALDQSLRPVWHNGKDKASYAPPDDGVSFWGQQPQPSLDTIVIVGDKVKVDKWTEYTDAEGNKYYHNPTKGPSTWDKPKDFDKMKNAGNPPPPTKPKANKGGKWKYYSARKGLL
eukprot:g6180.t1